MSNQNQNPKNEIEKNLSFAQDFYEEFFGILVPGILFVSFTSVSVFLFVTLCSPNLWNTTKNAFSTFFISQGQNSSSWIYLFLSLFIIFIAYAIGSILYQSSPKKLDRISSFKLWRRSRTSSKKTLCVKYPEINFFDFFNLPHIFCEWISKKVDEIDCNNNNAIEDSAQNKQFDITFLSLIILCIIDIIISISSIYIFNRVIFYEIIFEILNFSILFFLFAGTLLLKLCYRNKRHNKLIESLNSLKKSSTFDDYKKILIELFPLTKIYGGQIIQQLIIVFRKVKEIQYLLRDTPQDQSINQKRDNLSALIGKAVNTIEHDKKMWIIRMRIICFPFIIFTLFTFILTFFNLNVLLLSIISVILTLLIWGIFFFLTEYGRIFFIRIIRSLSLNFDINKMVYMIATKSKDFPYPNLRQYFIRRNKENYLKYIPWCGQSGKSLTQTKSTINELKRYIKSLNDKAVLFEIQKNEVDVRSLSACWSVMYYLKLWYICSIPVFILLKHYGVINLESRIPFILLFFLFLIIHWIKRIIEDSFHRVRIREVVLVLNAAFQIEHSSQNKENKEIKALFDEINDRYKNFYENVICKCKDRCEKCRGKSLSEQGNAYYSPNDNNENCVEYYDCQKAYCDCWECRVCIQSAEREMEKIKDRILTNT